MKTATQKAFQSASTEGGEGGGRLPGNHLFNPWLPLFKTRSQQGGARENAPRPLRTPRTPAKLRGAASYQNNESMNIRDSRAETRFLDIQVGKVPVTQFCLPLCVSTVRPLQLTLKHCNSQKIALAIKIVRGPLPLF